MKKLFVSGMLVTMVLCAGISEAVQTHLTVRAKSKDAKFIGTSMGGALITIKDSQTGKVLAEGLTAGGTGNTQKIMIEPKTRFGSIADDLTAKFEAVIDIGEPRLVTIDVDAPYGLKPNMVRSSPQIWMIPGKDITGEGIIVEVPGFSVSTNAPGEVTMVKKKATITVQARIVMI